MLLQTRETQETANRPAARSWELVGTCEAGGTPVSTPLNVFPFSIGRARENNLCLPSGVVSSRHAELVEVSGLLFIRDHGSTNGTKVNGQKIRHDTVLGHGDLVEIADTCLHLRLRESGLPGNPKLGFAGKTLNLQNSPAFSGPLSLQKLLKDGNLLPCFQSIHCLKTGEVRGYEYLARCSYPGIETAGQLFEQARMAGREAELSLLCRERAMAFAHRLHAGCPVFLNTHPAESLPTMAVPQLRKLRDAYPDRHIVLEIHEGAITEPALVRSVREELAEVNVRMAFDDFGRGQARIRELITVPADYIKFDSSLIRDLTTISSDQMQFIRTIVENVRKNGTITVAEGVETEEMAQVCREIGFDLVQGFLYNRPTILPATVEDTGHWAAV
jgi:EAL domain-containing protein (putative c-di-GMP-specific phosphodiesterase class I)